MAKDKKIIIIAGPNAAGKARAIAREAGASVVYSINIGFKHLSDGRAGD